MSLRISVVSEHAMRLGDKATKVFGVHGGSIGRGTDNDWILPDPERYLSGKHARIDFRAGIYILVDTSSNGTYVNGAQVPLGKYHDYQLKDGDYVRLGEYEMLVTIEKSNDFPPDESAIVAYDGKAVSSAVKKSTANDIGADLDLSELLEPSDQFIEASASRPRPNFDHATPPDEVPDEHMPGGDGGTPWHMMTRPLKVDSAAAADAAPPTPAAPLSGARAQPSPPQMYDGDIDIGIAAFCRGAGIEPRSITPDARASMLQLAGQLLRESVVGLMELNQSRHDFRNRFRIPVPAAEGMDSALNLSKGVEEALIRLLTTRSTRAGSIEALRENFREHKAQNGATVAAMRAAFEEFLERLDPKELEERFERASKRSVFGQTKAKYWELYAEMFGGLVQRPADGFPHLFIETFAKAYEAKLRTLVPPRRTTFGSDPNPPDVEAAGG